MTLGLAIERIAEGARPKVFGRAMPERLALRNIAWLRDVTNP